MDFQTFALIGFHSRKVCMLTKKGSGEKCEDFQFFDLSHQADIQLLIVKNSIRTEFYAASLVFHIHARDEEKNGKSAVSVPGLSVWKPGRDGTESEALRQSEHR